MTASLRVLPAWLVFWVVAATLTDPSGATADFTPGAVWLDTGGQPINAHGGGMLHHSNVYYWYGENKEGRTWMPEVNRGWDGYRVDVTGIRCYSSTNLASWVDQGLVLEAVPGDPASDLHPSMVAERPKVAFNPRTRKFVMWLHIDSADYQTARAGVAVAESPTGPFQYLGSVKPEGADSRDQTLFVDEDDRAYRVYASEWNQATYISLLSDDWLRHTGHYVKVFPGQKLEAYAVFKRAGRHYLIASGCTGWDPNRAVAAMADSIWGPWHGLGNPCRGADAETTFRSQSTFVFPVAGRADAYVFMADRWNKTDLPDSRLGWWHAALLRLTLEQPATSGQRQRLMTLLAETYRHDWSALLADFDPEGASDWQTLEHGGILYLRPGGDGLAVVRRFAGLLADRYYLLVRQIIRKYDQRALILGDRYQSFYYPEVARAASRYVEAVSSNLNAPWNDGTIPRFFLQTLHELTGKPVFVGEFYMAARANRSGNANSNGIFPIARNQRDRAAGFATTLRALLRLPDGFYRDHALPPSDRAEWSVVLRGAADPLRQEDGAPQLPAAPAAVTDTVIRCRVGAGLPPEVHATGGAAGAGSGGGRVQVVNTSGVNLNARNLAALRLPASLFDRARFRPGDTIRLQSAFVAHGGYRTEWTGEFKLAN